MKRVAGAHGFRTGVATAVVALIALIITGPLPGVGGAGADDAPLPQLSITDVTLNEGNAGITSFTFTVQLNAMAGAGGVTFDIATADNTATRGPDYFGSSLTGQTIPAGASTYTFTVMVSGDTVIEPNETFFVNVTNVTGALVLDGQATGTIVNDDLAGLQVTPTSGLTTTEAGGTDSFSVRLNGRPSSNVSVSLTSSDTTEGTVSPSTLTFTPDNWDTPQAVLVSGVDDALVDGSVPYAVTVAVSGGDPGFSTVGPVDVSVTNHDDDAPGITVTPTNFLFTTESGGAATFNVALTSQPTADVVIQVVSGNTTEGTVTPSSLTFTASDWYQPKPVTITGVDDPVVDGNVDYTIFLEPMTSDDPYYDGMNPPDVYPTNLDNDVAGVTVTPTSGLETTESGGTATFTVTVSSAPLPEYTLYATSGDSSEVSVSPASLTFTLANWDEPQTFTVTGVDDDDVDGSIPVTITLIGSSSDPAFQQLSVPSVFVTNLDDDEATTTTSTTTTSTTSTTTTTTAPTTTSTTTSTTAPPTSTSTTIQPTPGTRPPVVPPPTDGSTTSTSTTAPSTTTPTTPTAPPATPTQPSTAPPSGPSTSAAPPSPTTRPGAVAPASGARPPAGPANRPAGNAPAGGLARTGSSPGSAVAFAMTLVGAGVLASLAARRRARWV